MPSNKVRTRFAPSPTGYMHVGNLRTALYTYLMAKHEDGTFILRIEDTDQGRYVEGAVDVIYNTLRETGLLWDEGPDIGGPVGPYVQSERMGMFKQYAEQLVAEGKAYYCFCTEERLEALHAEPRANGEMTHYDGCCRDLPEEEVKQRLQNAKLDMVLESGYIQPFLDHKGLSFFSGVGVTERPDTLCAKISEGRVGVIVDGTPFALIVPHLFIENFQSIDDYSNRPFYALFLRALKFISFAISMLLPGIYVAVAIFHQELLPASMLFDIAVSEGRTPFPIMLEALVIHFIYEIMREAGLRMPKTVGHAVSIVGALVIGDAAVTAGLIAAPMLIVLALTAISSFVVPSLYEPAAVLRFLFIIVGGLTGLYGIMLILGLLILNACSINPYGVPYSAPITPFEKGAMRDLVLRVGWKRLGRYKMKGQDLNGSDKREPEDF